jgi:DNA (cytosine-5)-methyltransferase 1
MPNYPRPRIHPDIRHYHADTPVDAIVGGFPCTDVSLANPKAVGLAGSRSGLWSEFNRVIQQRKPTWVVFENVPNLLRIHNGADFARILHDLTGVPHAAPPDGWQTGGYATSDDDWHYDVAWRVLDSQFFGVPQRRRRVYLVGCLANTGRNPLKVLFERESLQGSDPTHLQKRKTNSQLLGESVDFASWPSIAPTIPASGAGTARTSAQTGNAHEFLVFDARSGIVREYSGTLQAKSTGGHSLNYINPVFDQQRIRRLTPEECESLQGFPKGWTKRKGIPETARYRMMGNAVTTNVIRWIGQRMLIEEASHK